MRFCRDHIEPHAQAILGFYNLRIGSCDLFFHFSDRFELAEEYSQRAARSRKID